MSGNPYQHPQKLNVLAGIMGDHIAGSLFIVGNLNEATYLELLENILDPIITAIVEVDDNFLKDQIMFQQGGARPHYGVQVGEVLNERFPTR